jgi:hypothetical protein
MLVDFFKLNGTYTTFNSQPQLLQFLSNSRDARNILYDPSTLSPANLHPKLKIHNTKFTNFSFSKTKITDVSFFNCKFEDCLFIGAEFVDCEFHNCEFKNCNTFKIVIKNTHVDPANFYKCIQKFAHANIAVHLFQQLLHNSDERTQSKFTRVAEYNFKKWQNRLTLNKFWNKKPYPISFWKFIVIYPINWLYKWSFGYGLRLRNFVVTFLLIFGFFFTINKSEWKSYGLHQKDLVINSFSPDSSNFQSNFLYTLDATTKLVDSQFQATSRSGMNWLTIQSIFGFILLGGLVTIIFNRFIK